MAEGEASAHGSDMHSVLRHAPPREADNELYDRACDLLEAATAIRIAAARPEAVSSAPAVLACVEESIRELSLACVAVERAVADTAAAPSGDDRRRRRVIDRMHRGFENLSGALDDAQRATGAARALVARALAVAAREPRRHRRS